MVYVGKMKIIDLIGEKEDFGIKEFGVLLKIYGEDWWWGKWYVKIVDYMQEHDGTNL